jgi:hypothetical protein
MAITYMTPEHRTLVDTTLVAVHNRTVELINATNCPIGKKPGQPTIESARQSPLGRDLDDRCLHRGHQIDRKEVDAAIQRVLCIIYGYILNQKGTSCSKTGRNPSWVNSSAQRTPA